MSYTSLTPLPEHRELFDIRSVAERRYMRAEVEAVVENPARGRFAPPARDIIEHFGYAADGRLLNVVTNRAETLVITVIAQ